MSDSWVHRRVAAWPVTVSYKDIRIL